MALHTAWIKKLSPDEAKARLPLALFGAIALTFICAGHIGVAILNAVLQKDLLNKAIGFLTPLVALAGAALLWQVYFCVKKRAAERE